MNIEYSLIRYDTLKRRLHYEIQNEILLLNPPFPLPLLLNR